MGRVITKL